jgi:uroporphyrinogen-III synthase
MPELPLAGLRVLVTRPRGQARELCRALQSAGAQVTEFPVLEIVPVPADLPPAALAESAAAIFVSVNAVEHGVPLLRRGGGLPAGAQVFAIGRATAAALQNAGFANVVSPPQNIDSEGLLAVPQLQAVQGENIILMKGRSEQGGRKALENVLAERGAVVRVVECYERRNVAADGASVAAAGVFFSQAGTPLVMALSVETLDALLVSLASRMAQLRASWLLVPHPRVAQAARDRGFFLVQEVPMSAEVLVPALVSLKSRFEARID